MIAALLRYVRMMGHLARYTLSRELAFRGNFLVKVSVELLWLGILIAFYRTVFAKTSHIADWSEPERAKAGVVSRIKAYEPTDELQILMELSIEPFALKQGLVASSTSRGTRGSGGDA